MDSLANVQPQNGRHAQGQARRPMRCAAAALAVALAACAHSPHAAVPEGSVSEQIAVASGCTESAAQRAAIGRIAQELQAQGLALQARCPEEGAGWVVQVRVVDGMKASKIVRGPLADGHDVDMGTPAGVSLAGAEPGAHGFSPDVQYNRAWLRALMARHQFESAPDAWWRFARRGSVPPRAADTDLAVR